MTPERKAVEALGLVDLLASFRDLMMEALRKKLDQGYVGWDEDQEYDPMWHKLHKHVKLAEEGNTNSYVHIANLAMFLHNLKVERDNVTNRQ